MTDKQAKQTVEVDEWEHSPLGPSAAERWLECPGSVLWTKDMEDRSGEDAILGTAAHTVTEWCRTEGKVAEEYLGQTVRVKLAHKGKNGEELFRDILVDQEMCDAVNTFCEYVERFPGDPLIEERVHYDAWVPHGFGTSDDMRVDNGRCVVSDYKHGKGIQVYAENNPQLRLYALGVYHDFGYLYDIKEFQLNIVQPRLDHIDETVISLEDLIVWANTIVKPAAELAMKPGAPFKAGDWCRWCRGKNICRTRAKKIFDDAVGDFEGLDENTEVAARNPNDLSLDEIGLMLPFLDTIKAFCGDMEQHALSEIGKGNTITHPVMGPYKIVEGRSNRAWANIADEGEDKDEAIAKRLRAEKLKVADIYTKKLKGPAAIEKIIGKKHPLLEELVIKPQGKPKLVPGTDKRPAITVNLEDEFDALPEEEND